MLVGGIIGAVVGLIFLIIGIIKNNSLLSMLASQSEHPGTVFIIIGIILLVAGAALICYSLYKKKKK